MLWLRTLHCYRHLAALIAARCHDLLQPAVWLPGPGPIPRGSAGPDHFISFSGQLSSPVQALHRYQHLAALISGEEPRNLLQPAGQRRYLAQRIEELAQGTCVREFAWNSGGSFDGRPWSSELPSDADLVFYLVAAYMEVGVC